MMTCKFENADIRIAHTVPEDLDMILAIEQDPANILFVMPYDKNRHALVLSNEDEAHFSIREKNTGNLIGYIILAGLTSPNRSMELRRMVLQSKGKGFGRQCLKFIKEYCFTELKFHRLWLDVFSDNGRAVHLYQSEGFHTDGCLREAVQHGDTYRSLYVMSLLEQEYQLLTRAT